MTRSAKNCNPFRDTDRSSGHCHGHSHHCGITMPTEYPSVTSPRLSQPLPSQPIHTKQPINWPLLLLFNRASVVGGHPTRTGIWSRGPDHNTPGTQTWGERIHIPERCIHIQRMDCRRTRALGRTWVDRETGKQEEGKAGPAWAALLVLRSRATWYHWEEEPGSHQRQSRPKPSWATVLLPSVHARLVFSGASSGGSCFRIFHSNLFSHLSPCDPGACRGQMLGLSSPEGKTCVARRQ